MSDLTEDLGAIFDTTANTSADSGFLSDVAQLFDSGSSDAATTAASSAAAPIDESAGLNMSAPPQAAPVPDAQQASVPVDTPPAPPAPAPSSMQSAAPTSDLSTPAAKTPSAASWFKNLSPGAQAILASGTAGGAAGLLNALAQKNTMDEQEKLINQQREDTIRRGHVAAFSPNAFQPKGVIDGVRGP